jgi:transcriptional regulator with XRE-family HTH domain
MQPAGSPDRSTEIALLATDLRRLRLEAGNPTLLHLQEESGVSKSALSDALNGKQLPSERTLDSLVRALGGDSGAWLDRRVRLTLALSESGPASGSPAAEASTSSEHAPPTEPRPFHGALQRRLSIPAVALLTVVAFGAGAAVATGITSADDRGAAVGLPTPEDSPLLAAATGVDPVLTDCIDDADAAALETRIETVVLEVIWSDQCQAGWGRITRNDNQTSGNSVHIEVYPVGPNQDADRQESTMDGVQGAYTHMVVRTDAETRLCADGSITRDGETIDLGAPLCT